MDEQLAQNDLKMLLLLEKKRFIQDLSNHLDDFEEYQKRYSFALTLLNTESEGKQAKNIEHPLEEWYKDENGDDVYHIDVSKMKLTPTKAALKKTTMGSKGKIGGAIEGYTPGMKLDVEDI